jgi:glycosyltransferase involved in cell wall biosynthesis
MNKNIFVIPQPMIMIAASARNVRSKNSCIRLLTVTNLAYRAKYYGVLELIDFLQKYAKQTSLDYRIVFQICGEGNFENHLKKKLAVMTTNQGTLSVRYLGFVENLKAIYEMAHLFLYSSNLDSLPRVLLEAQASGLPILANDFDPFQEVVRNNYNGLLYKSGDFHDFREKLHLLITNPDLRNFFGKNSLENLKTNHSIEAIGAKLEGSLSKVLHPDDEGD